jgi:hypothetical protein
MPMTFPHVRCVLMPPNRLKCHRDECGVILIHTSASSLPHSVGACFRNEQKLSSPLQLYHSIETSLF